MDLLAWLALGIAAGAFAQFVLHDKWTGGVSGNLIAGAIGAVIAGWVARATGVLGASGTNVWILMIAFAGAAGLLYAGRAFTAPNRIN